MELNSSPTLPSSSCLSGRTKVCGVFYYIVFPEQLQLQQKRLHGLFTTDKLVLYLKCGSIRFQRCHESPRARDRVQQDAADAAQPAGDAARAGEPPGVPPHRGGGLAHRRRGGDRRHLHLHRRGHRGEEPGGAAGGASGQTKYFYF